MTTDTPTDVSEAIEAAFRAGHWDGWRGNQLRRRAQHDDATDGWNAFKDSRVVREALTAAEQDRWQDIATAPRDGTWILAVQAPHVPLVTYWESEVEDWRDANYGVDDYVFGIWHPTHWHPLPPAPVHREERG